MENSARRSNTRRIWSGDRAFRFSIVCSFLDLFYHGDWNSESVEGGEQHGQQPGGIHKKSLGI